MIDLTGKKGDKMDGHGLPGQPQYEMSHGCSEPQACIDVLSD
jgi:hypothetical protein